MALKEEILNYLSEHSGDYISGEELAQNLGKSRAGVWKAVKALQADGYTITAVTNRGYMFDANNDILNENEIKKYIDFDCNVAFYKSIDSTNNEAKRIITDGDTKPLLVVGEEQTAGRGRQGKSFYSPAKTGIYMSLVVHPMAKLQNAVTATTAASVAVCKAIEKLTDITPQIQWVHDVYVDGKKICGILIKNGFRGDFVDYSLTGVGINVNNPIAPEISDIAISMREAAGKTFDIDSVFFTFLKNAGEKVTIDEYKSYSAVLGKRVQVIRANETFEAKAVDISDDGRLVLENGEKLSAAELDLKIRL